MLTMAQMKHHFLRSRYIECLQSLENVSCKQHSIDAWNKQSNIIACNLMVQTINNFLWDMRHCAFSIILEVKLKVSFIKV